MGTLYPSGINDFSFIITICTYTKCLNPFVLNLKLVLVIEFVYS